jgi:hypothetical protein
MSSSFAELNGLLNLDAVQGRSVLQVHSDQSINADPTRRRPQHGIPKRQSMALHGPELIRKVLFGGGRIAYVLVLVARGRV